MKAAPILGNQGWLDTPEMVIDQILGWFIVTDQYQTTLYKGNYSLPGIVALYKDDNYNLQLKTEEALRGMFSNYFDDVDIAVSVSETDGSSTITLKGSVTSKGQSYPIDKAIPLVDSKFMQVSKENEQ